MKAAKKIIREELESLLEKWVASRGPDDIFVNPTPIEFARDLGGREPRTVTLDAIINEKGDVYMWRAEHMKHEDAIDLLRLDVEDDRLITLYVTRSSPKEAPKISLSLTMTAMRWTVGAREEIRERVESNRFLNYLYRDTGFRFMVDSPTIERYLEMGN